jgi:hypothetical protein
VALNFRRAFPPQPPGGRKLTDRVSSHQLLAALHPVGTERRPPEGLDLRAVGSIASLPSAII